MIVLIVTIRILKPEPERDKHMKKITSALLALLMLSTTACTLKPGKTEPADGRAAMTAAAEAVTEFKPQPTVMIQLPTDVEIDLSDIDFPDNLLIKEGGTAAMTLFKCGKSTYACIDGSDVWEVVSEPAEAELKDGEFIHVDAKYKLLSGGVKGFKNRKQITSVSNEKSLSPDEVVSNGSLLPYDASRGFFQSPRLIVKDGRNYIICRDSLHQYRLYDDKGERLCTEDSYMACAGFLEDTEPPVSYSRSGNFPFWVVRIGDSYYAYSRFAGNDSWKALLNMQSENRPVGFVLEDGQVMKVDSTMFYLVNGGEKNYVNIPMFEKMEHFHREHYSALNSDCSKDHWDRVSSYENGRSYQYYADNTEYVIFCLEGRYHVYSGKDTEKLLGVYSSPEEVNSALGL